MTSSNDAEVSQSISQYLTGFTIRSYLRFPVKCAVEYRGPDCVRKGILRNLSRSGWRIEGNHAVTPGMILMLAVSFPGDSVPVKVEKVIVRWANAHAFGIRIIEMQPVDAARLGRFVMLLEQQGLPSPDSPPFTPVGALIPQCPNREGGALPSDLSLINTYAFRFSLTS